MRKTNLQQEVLLVTGTSFASEELCKKEDPHQNGPLFENERLEEACWNGMIQTRLPEIFLQATGGGMLFLWQVKEATSFLVLDLGEAPADIDNRFSIVPYSFLSTQSYS
jgi:hypothetical protein